MPNNVVYSTTKYAVRGFMEALNMDLHIQELDQFIHNTTIFPYFINTQPAVSEYLEKSCKFTFLLNQKVVADAVFDGILYNRETVMLPSPFRSLFYM